MKQENSRRKFIKISSVSGLSAALGMGLPLDPFAKDIHSTHELFPNGKKLHIKPRYHRWHVDPGQAWLETNTRYAQLDWHIPVSQTALVLLDVWQRHYIKEMQRKCWAFNELRSASLSC